MIFAAQATARYTWSSVENNWRVYTQLRTYVQCTVLLAGAYSGTVPSAFSLSLSRRTLAQSYANTDKKDADLCLPTPHLDTDLTAAMPGEQVIQHTNKQFPYAEALGAVRYLADSTRPDIAYAVSFLERYSTEPAERHWRALLRVIQYLAGTSEHGLTYGPENDDLEKLSQ
jgi:hypothetical protein